MKKILLLIILVGIGYFGYNYLKNEEIIKDSPKKFIYADILDNAISEVKIEKFTIYGKHMNVLGTLPQEKGDYTLVFKNEKEELPIKTIIDNNVFKTNQYINEGINLEKLNIGNYLLMLKEKTNNTYYTLVNDTEYHNNEYYTITKNNKNNLITFNEEEYNNKKYFLIKCEETKLPENIYDIIIDPGHGGIDTGAGNGKYHESKFTLDYSKALYDALTEEGLKVKLTRESDVSIDHYGEGSRTGIPYETKAKLMLSIHLNSSNSTKQRGVEIYKAYNDNNVFAKILADNLVSEVGTIYSNNPQNKVENGIYMRVYSSSDIANTRSEAIQKGYEPYTIDDTTTYYYFIRETGGINTKAFSDGRNPQYKANPYRDYNQGVEAYLCELAYISQGEDLKLILNKKDSFVKALKESILNYIDKEDINNNS